MDKMGRDALFYAIVDREQKAIEMLDIAENINFRDCNGVAYLHAAVQSGFFEVIQKLIALGCKIDIQDKFGKTPLMVALSNFNGDDSIIKFLVHNGANINASAKSGVSCVRLAQMKGYDELPL